MEEGTLKKILIWFNSLSTYYPYGRKQRKTKKPLDESERGEWKSWLNINIQKTKIMASGPITSNRWGNNGNNDRLFWRASKSLLASLVAQRLKQLPGMQETWVQSLGREGPLEKEMATHSSTLAWRIPWREEPGRLQSTGSQRVRHDWATELNW